MSITNEIDSKPVQKTSSGSLDKPVKFWVYKITSKSSGEWKIEHRKFIEHLRYMGFRRFDIGANYIFIRIKDHILNEVQIHIIQDAMMKYIDKLDDQIEPEIVHEDKTRNKLTRNELINKFITSHSLYFNDKKMSFLGKEENLLFNTDTKETGFIYYSNCFVKCTSTGYECFPYSALSGYVFRNQIKDRKFYKNGSDGMFKSFVYNIAGKSDQRFKALQTMIGYLLHSFFDTKMKAVNLTDSTISENAEGRTGKTLVGHAISKIKNVCEISGKDFDPGNKHKYATAKLDTQIVFLNDLKKRFDFENLFNDISDAITIDQKNMQPFTITAKMLIASNDTFKIAGASAKDRVIEFELANYYNAQFSPIDEFKVWFFTDWDEDEWSKFDNFMMECLTQYLKFGIIEADSINLDKRKQISSTNRDFVEFMDEKIKAGLIRCGIDYDKASLHDEFLNDYPDYKSDKWLKTTGNFIKYFKNYVNYCPELRGEIKERKSSGHTYIRIDKDGDKLQKSLFDDDVDVMKGLPF